MDHLAFCVLLVVAVLCLLNWLETRQTNRRLKTMGTALDKLTADVAAQDAALGKAIVTLDSIPQLIKDAQNSDNPDEALEALSADIEAHTASLKQAQDDSGQAGLVALSVSPTSASFAVGVASSVPVTISGGTGPYTVSGLLPGVTYDGTANLVADDTTIASTGTATVSDSAPAPDTQTVPITVTIS